jgi:hypothetical protein
LQQGSPFAAFARDKGWKHIRPLSRREQTFKRDHHGEAADGQHAPIMTVQVIVGASLVSVSVAPAAATPAATAEVSLDHRFRFVNREGAAVKLRPIQLRDRFVRIFFRHRYKTKAFRAACVAVANDAHSFHCAAVRKSVANIILSGLERKVSNKQFF